MRIWFYGDSWTRGDEASEELNHTHSDICETDLEYPYVGAFTETVQSELGIECINRGISGGSNMCALIRYCADSKYRSSSDFVVLGLSDYFRLFSFSIHPGLYTDHIHLDRHKSVTVYNLQNYSRGHRVAQMKINNQKILLEEDKKCLENSRMVCEAFIHMQKNKLLIFSAFTDYTTGHDKKTTKIMKKVLDSPTYESFYKKHSAQQYLFDHLDNQYSGSQTGYIGELFSGPYHHPNLKGYQVLGKYLAFVLSNRL